MLFSTPIRFQEVHRLLTRLLFQPESQRPIAVIRDQAPQFVLLPIHLYRKLRKRWQPYERQFPLTVRLIGITAFRKGMLSFARACTLFDQGGAGRAEILVILRHNNPAGAVFLAERYEALLAFLEARGVPGLEAFACGEETDQTVRTLPIAAAVQSFTDLPAQFAHELSITGVNLPILVSKNNQMVLAVFPWALFQAVMRELTARDVSGPVEALVTRWCATRYVDEIVDMVAPGEPPSLGAYWILCLKGDAIDLLEHYPYRTCDRVSVEARTAARDGIPCSAFRVYLLAQNGRPGDEQLAYLRAVLPSATVFAVSDALYALLHPSALPAQDEG